MPFGKKGENVIEIGKKGAGPSLMRTVAAVLEQVAITTDHENI
jgi:hypothetical protein